MTLASFFCLFQKPRYIAMLPSCCFFWGGGCCCCCSILLLMRALMMMMRAPAHDEKVTNWKKKNKKSFLRKNGFSFSKLRTRVGLAPPCFFLYTYTSTTPIIMINFNPIKTTPKRRAHEKDNNLSLYCGTLFHFVFPASSFLFFFFPFAPCAYELCFNWFGRTTLFRQ